MMELENLVLAYNLQFFAKDGPGGEKTEPATSKKLDDVRKEGQVAKSKELISAVSLLALFVLIKVYIGIVGEKLLKVIQDFYYTFDKNIREYKNNNNIPQELDAKESFYYFVYNQKQEIWLHDFFLFDCRGDGVRCCATVRDTRTVPQW